MVPQEQESPVLPRLYQRRSTLHSTVCPALTSSQVGSEKVRSKLIIHYVEDASINHCFLEGVKHFKLQQRNRTIFVSLLLIYLLCIYLFVCSTWLI